MLRTNLVWSYVLLSSIPCLFFLNNCHFEFPLNIDGYPLIWVYHLSFWPWHILAYMYIFHTHKNIWLYMYMIYTCMYSYYCVMIMSHKPGMFASFTREGPIYQGNWADHEMKATLRNGLRTDLHERRECATHTYIYIYLLSHYGVKYCSYLIDWCSESWKLCNNNCTTTPHQHLQVPHPSHGQPYRKTGSFYKEPSFAKTNRH